MHRSQQGFPQQEAGTQDPQGVDDEMIVTTLKALVNDLLTTLKELAPGEPLPAALHGAVPPQWRELERKGDAAPTGPSALQAAQRLRSTALAVSTVRTVVHNTCPQ